LTLDRGTSAQFLPFPNGTSRLIDVLRSKRALVRRGEIAMKITIVKKPKADKGKKIAIVGTA
jgi:hypothetical protein